MWLKVFENVEIHSNYKENDQVKRRNFVFDVDKEVLELTDNTKPTDELQTVVNLNGFNAKYANVTHKSLDKIAFGLLEHCLWYFIRTEGVPHIMVSDDEGAIDLIDLFDKHMHSSSSNEKIKIKKQIFKITHVKVSAERNKQHTIGYCASGRLVKEESLNKKIPGLYNVISDDSGQFTYMAYLTGDYLDNCVSNERVAFNIQEKSDDLFEDTEISFSDIRNAVFPLVSDYLKTSLDELLTKGRDRVQNYVSTKAPKYRPLLNYISKEKLSVDPNISEKDLDILLHKETYEVEKIILEEGHELLSVDTDYEDYEERMKSYVTKAADLKQADLANYVAHRRVVVDILERAIKLQKNGKFIEEKFIHELIVPMGTTSDDIRYQKQNLWLLDERLAFHHYLASDTPISNNPTTTSTSKIRPDLSALRIFNNPILVGEQNPQMASITVVEIKRPMRIGFKEGSENESDPIYQSLKYLKCLREGAKKIDGKLIPNSEKIPGFVYVLTDFTESLKECCKYLQLKATADGMGYYGHHSDDTYNAYIQVMSFDGLIASAKERNQAFLDKLSLPTN